MVCLFKGYFCRGEGGIRYRIERRFQLASVAKEADDKERASAFVFAIGTKEVKRDATAVIQRKKMTHNRKCDCCKVNAAQIPSSAESGFCLQCINAAEEFSKCPECGNRLPLLEMMGAAIGRVKLICQSCQKSTVHGIR